MNLIPVKVKDGAPRNSIGQLISLANKFDEGIFAQPCSASLGRAEGPCKSEYGPDCKACQKILRARNRWLDYLKKDLGI